MDHVRHRRDGVPDNVPGWCMVYRTMYRGGVPGSTGVSNRRGGGMG